MPARSPVEQGTGPSKHSRREEFSQFFKQQYPRLVVFLQIAGLPSKEAAEDAAQEAFITLFNKWDSVQSPTAWLRVVSMRNAYRHQGGRNVREELFPSIPDYYVAPEESERLSFEKPVTEIDAVLKVIRELPTRQRHIMALTYDGYSPREIGKMLGLESVTVRSSLRKARSALAHNLRDFNSVNL